MGPVRKILEKYLLKVANLKPIQECEKAKDRRSLLLNPDLVSSFRDLDDHVKDLSAVADIDSKHFRFRNTLEQHHTILDINPPSDTEVSFEQAVRMLIGL